MCESGPACTCGAVERAIERAKAEGASKGGWGSGEAWAFALMICFLALVLLTCTAGRDGWLPWQ
jgi:hypothetical protein